MTNRNGGLAPVSPPCVRTLCPSSFQTVAEYAADHQGRVEFKVGTEVVLGWVPGVVLTITGLVYAWAPGKVGWDDLLLELEDKTGRRICDVYYHVTHVARKE